MFLTNTFLLYLQASGVAALTAFFVFRRRSEAGLKHLSYAALSIAVWSLSSAFELVVVQFDLKIVLLAVEGLMGNAIANFYLFFILEYYHLKSWLPSRGRWLIWAPGLVTFAMILTNELHHLYWPRIYLDALDNTLYYFEHGPLYYASIVFQFFFFCVILVILFRQIFRSDKANRQGTTLIILSIIFPTIPYGIYVIWPGQPLTIQVWPVTLAFGCLMIAWTVFDQLEKQVSQKTAEMEKAVRNLEAEVERRERVETNLLLAEDQLAQRVAEQGRSLEGVYRLMRNASRAGGLPLHDALKEICDTLGANASFIYQASPESGFLDVSYGLSTDQADAMQKLIESWLAEPGFLATPDLYAYPDKTEALRRSGFASALCAPLPPTSQSARILSFFWIETKNFSLEEIELFKALCNQTGLLVEILTFRRKSEINATMQERRRLARDLHDSVTQSLNGLFITAHSAIHRLEQQRFDRLEESLKQITHGARQALGEMRLLLYEMRLEPLEKINVAQTLQQRLEAVERRSGIETAFNLIETVEWPQRWNADLYRFAIEALNNVLKHAQASEVILNLSSTDTGLTMEIIDNGKGFDPTNVSPGGMGLSSMAERAERLNGILIIDSAPGKGACVCLQIRTASAGLTARADT